MKAYNNAGGGGNLLGAVAGIAVTTLFQMDEAKRNKEFTKQLESLTQEQQAELEKGLTLLKTQLEREKYLVEFVTNAKSEELKKEAQKKRMFLYAGLAIALIGTGILFIKLKQKK